MTLRSKVHESLTVTHIVPSRRLLRKSLTGHRAFAFGKPHLGALAQLGERLICIQEVRSSILLGSTTSSSDT